MEIARGITTGSITAVTPAPRPTDMETLAERLAGNLSSLRDLNDRLQGGLDFFQPAPSADEGDSAAASAPPPPGTAAYLESLTISTTKEIARLSTLVGRVRTIF